MNITRQVSFLVFLLQSLPVLAQAPAQDEIRTTYNQLYQGDVNGAYGRFRALAERDPQNLGASFGVLMALFDRGLSDPLRQKEFEQRIDDLIQKASTRYEKSRKDTDALFYLGQAHLQRGRYRAEFGKGIWGAARDGIKAKNYGEEYIKADPARADGYFGVGIYNYYVELVPAFFKFLRPLLFMPAGNRAEGLKQVERTAAEGALLSPIAQISLIGMYVVENRFADAMRTAENLQRKYPDNPQYRVSLAGLYSNPQVAEYERAGEQYAEIIQGIEQKHPNYKPEGRYQAILSLARIRQQQWRYGDAIATLNRVIDSNVQQPEWVMPNFLLSRAGYRARTVDARYIDDLHRVLGQKNWKDWHKNAQNEMKALQQRQQSGEAAVFAELIPANRLVVERRWDEARRDYERIRARRPEDWQVRYRLAYLEFASGDYDRAYTAFSQIVNNNPANAPNWVKADAILYLARVFDMRGQRDQALRLYKRVVDDYESEEAAQNARPGLIVPYRRTDGGTRG